MAKIDLKSAERQIAPIVERTERGWKQDLVDTMNRTLNPEAKRSGLKWMIAGNGDVYLDFTFKATRQNIEGDYQRQEAEREDWKRATGFYRAA